MNGKILAIVLLVVDAYEEVVVRVVLVLAV
jgi:hypothetical protein